MATRSFRFCLVLFFTLCVVGALNSVFSAHHHTGGIVEIAGLSRQSLAKSLKVLLSAFFILIPIALVVKSEALNSTSLTRANKTTLQLLKKSEGHSHADLWYFCLTLIGTKLPLVTLGTFGLMRFYSPLDSAVQSFVLSRLPEFIAKPSIEVSILVALSYIVAADFIKYFSHFLMHRIRLLWELHEFHHSASEMVIFNKDRATFQQQLFIQPLIFPITASAGIFLNITVDSGYTLPLVIYGIYISLDFISNVLGHSSLQVIYPKPFSYVLMSPALHWLHHSNQEKHYDSNFGGVSCVWDRLFRTYIGEDRLCELQGFGVEGTEYNKHHPLVAYFLLPYVKVFRLLRLQMANLF